MSIGGGGDSGCVLLVMVVMGKSRGAEWDGVLCSGGAMASSSPSPSLPPTLSASTRDRAGEEEEREERLWNSRGEGVLLETTSGKRWGHVSNALGQPTVLSRGSGILLLCS